MPAGGVSIPETPPTALRAAGRALQNRDDDRVTFALVLRGKARATRAILDGTDPA
ncbi:hypothetical protein [Micromonospora sp. NPDC048898]|uniref:hypothetical protein n=1 Tax=Micromonospora sp. NPDC048898 TaxID=3364260 RepID=UPI003717F0DE